MRSAAFLALFALAAPLMAKDSLGVFSGWAAFRDPAVPRCYAIAEAQESARSRDFAPYATIASWPKSKVRGQVHFRLSRQLAGGAVISLRVGKQSFRLVGGKADAWAQGRTMDAAIVAAMRSAPSMAISTTDNKGRRFTDSYSLAGAATAMDAASLACSGRN